MTIKHAIAILAVLLSSGCLAPAGKPVAPSACSFDQVWDNAVAALGDFPLQTADKAAGALETNWMEVDASTRAGALQRDVNRERLKYVVEVKSDGRRAVATVVQLREAWSPMGVQSRQWRAIVGNSSEEEALAAAITKRLKEKGC